MGQNSQNQNGMPPKRPMMPPGMPNDSMASPYGQLASQQRQQAMINPQNMGHPAPTGPTGGDKGGGQGAMSPMQQMLKRMAMMKRNSTQGAQTMAGQGGAAQGVPDSMKSVMQGFGGGK